LDGRNVQIVVRWGSGNEAETRKYAEEIVALAPDVILATGTGAELMLKATRTIPVVFAVVTDPMGSGFVQSLSRPGGNVTGFMQFEYALWKVAGVAQGDCAKRNARCSSSRSDIRFGNRPVRRHSSRGAVRADEVIE
jgi:ABC transporter substrate binding protein